MMYVCMYVYYVCTCGMNFIWQKISRILYSTQISDLIRNGRQCPGAQLPVTYGSLFRDRDSWLRPSFYQPFCDMARSTFHFSLNLCFFIMVRSCFFFFIQPFSIMARFNFHLLSYFFHFGKNLIFL